MSRSRKPFFPLMRGALALALAVSAASCSVHVPVMDRDASAKNASERLDRVRQEQPAPAAAVDLHDALARALMYNLDYRAAWMTEALARSDLSRSSFALWPQLALGAGYSSRDKDAASVSRDPLTGAQTLQPSVSSERSSTTAQLQMSWNALDFGVGYLRAKQKGNAALVAEEQRRKAFQAISQEVTVAWWRALAAQRVQPRLEELRARVESALERSRQMEELRLRTSMPVLDYRRDLLLSMKRLSSLHEEVLNARNDLVRLIALPEGTQLTLAEPAAGDDPAWLPALSKEQMQRIALANRPELREFNYRQRIAALEGKVAVAALMPSLNFYAGPRHDSNKFLVNNDWTDAGVQFSFNLLNLAALPAARRYSRAGAEAESLRADAMTAAVVSQVSLALRAVETDRSGWCLSRELGRVAEEREAQQRARAVSSSGDELTQIRTEVEGVLAVLESAFSQAELQASHALLLNTLGVDPYPENLSKGSAADVATELRSYYAQGLKDRLAKDAEALSSGQAGAPVLKPFAETCVL